MPGFFIVANRRRTDVALKREECPNFAVKRLESEHYFAEQHTVNKFIGDKAFVETECCIVITEGVVLNKADLIKKYLGEGEWGACVERMYFEVGDRFFNEFRGSFSGALYDKRDNKWLVYVSHIGDKQVFHTEIGGEHIFASDIADVVAYMHKRGIHVEMDSEAAYLILTRGSVVENKTTIVGVDRLSAGRYYELKDGQLQDLQYHRFSNTPCNITFDDAVEGIDELFCKAVEKQFKKDEEYGYKHIAFLSGGLDSRMTVWVAHELGYTQQLNLTFSQSNYLDFSIAQQIASDLKHDFIFKSLDNGNCLYLVDRITDFTYGTVSYFGLAHGSSLIDNIRFDEYGLIHSGQIGDIVIGTFNNSVADLDRLDTHFKCYSAFLADKLDAYKYKECYDNTEIFALYNRAFSCALQGNTAGQRYTESVSPFCDVELLQFCFNLPPQYRINHRIYFEWILRKHKGAGKYVWETIKRTIEEQRQILQRQEYISQRNSTVKIGKYDIPSIGNPLFGEYLKGFVLRRLGLRKKGGNVIEPLIPSAYDMNPLDYWYYTNQQLREFIDNYYHSTIELIKDVELRNSIKRLFTEGNAEEKTQCLSVLSLAKKIYS